MIFSNACLIVASMAMIPTAFSQNQGAPGSIIGGVTLKTDVTAELEKDLVFKQLTDKIKSESCADLALGKSVYDANSWLSSMPTYTENAGTELKLYEKYYGEGFLNKWVNAAFSNQNVKIEKWEADFSKLPGETDGSGDCVGREGKNANAVFRTVCAIYFHCVSKLGQLVTQPRLYRAVQLHVNVSNYLMLMVHCFRCCNTSNHPPLLSLQQRNRGHQEGDWLHQYLH
jgi:hypothetical protein